jgi:predicted aspartyl protease
MNDKKINGSVDGLGYIYIMTSVINLEKGIRIDDVKTIIDTGAFSSFIQKDLAVELKLSSIKTAEYTNPLEGKIKAEVFSIELIIGKTQITKFRITEFNQKTYPCGILIGMDLIKYCELTYSGKNKTFEMILPDKFV